MMLPSHTKSKSIYFLNSPKQWTRNFLCYLEKNHPKLYTSVNQLFCAVKIILTVLFVLITSYYFGHFILDYAQRNIPVDNVKYMKQGTIKYYILSTTLGFSVHATIMLVYVLISLIGIEFFKNIFTNTHYFIMNLQTNTHDFIVALQTNTHDFIVALQTNTHDFIVALQKYKSYREEFVDPESDCNL
jgi:hypothetical protein